MLSNVAVLSGPTSYERITTVWLYPTPPSTISPWRYGSTNCFFVGIFWRSCSLVIWPFSAMEETEVNAVAAPTVWLSRSTLAVGIVEVPCTLMLFSFCLFGSWGWSLLEHLMEQEAGQQREAIFSLWCSKWREVLEIEFFFFLIETEGGIYSFLTAEPPKTTVLTTNEETLLELNISKRVIVPVGRR